MADSEGRTLTVAMSAGQDSSGSDSSGTSEEERLRRLFNSCDADGDGFLDGYVSTRFPFTHSID